MELVSGRCSMSLAWTDARDLAIELMWAYPDVDPVEVGREELRAMVVRMLDFDDDPAGGTLAEIEAIRLAWLEELEGESGADRAGEPDRPPA
jgi:FeS assembly protein IscX